MSSGIESSRICRVCLCSSDGAGLSSISNVEGAGLSTLTNSYDYREQGITMTSLFSGDFGVMPSVMMMICTKLKVYIGDGLPSSICNNCIYRLGVAYHFKQQCENSDTRLRQYLGMPMESTHFTKDAETNTDRSNTDLNSTSPRKVIIPAKRIKKRGTYKRKPEHAQLKRGPKPKEKEPQTCYQCNKTFKCAAQLVMHIRTHTGERPFSCTYCSRRFAQKHNLSTHIRTHTGEKPFQCEICSKRFSALGNFQSHQKIHSGIRDQICPICSKAFLSSGDLSRHMVTHTGIKNHHCEICGKGFYRNRDLITHKYKVHNIEKPIPPGIPATDDTVDTVIRRSMSLATPSARRPMQPFRDDALINNSLVNDHMSLNYM